MRTLKYHSQVGIITNSSTELFVIENPREDLEDILQAMIVLHNQINGTCLEYKDVFKALEIYDQETFKEDALATKRWVKVYGDDFSWGYEKSDNVGKTMLYGTCDNSIPYWMFDLIEEFAGQNVEKFHLG